MTNLLVISSNLTNDVVDPFAIVDYYNLACDESGLYDNSMIMLLRLLSFIEIRDVTVAGFDGLINLNLITLMRNIIKIINIQKTKIVLFLIT